MSNLPKTDSRPKSSPLRFVAMGCGALLFFFLVFIGIVFNQIESNRKRPVDKATVLASLAGVPIYPGSKFDEEGTRDGRAVLSVFQATIPSKLSTVAGFRTSADPDKEVLPFYDKTMQDYGFQKTRLGGDVVGRTGASYSDGETSVIVQLKEEPGEERRLLLFRFDAEKRPTLGKPSDKVTPEDFHKANPKKK